MTRKRNRRALDRLAIRQDILVDARELDTQTSLLGVPLLVGTGMFLGVAARRGRLETAAVRATLLAPMRARAATPKTSPVGPTSATVRASRWRCAMRSTPAAPTSATCARCSWASTTPTSRPLGSWSQVLERVRPVTDKLPLPPGYRVWYGGEYENQQETFPEMVKALFISSIAIYLILMFQFRSKQSLNRVYDSIGIGLAQY